MTPQMVYSVHCETCWSCSAINVYNNAKEKLPLSFWVTKIKTDTAGAWCNQPPPPFPSLIGLTISNVYLSVRQSVIKLSKSLSLVTSSNL